MSDDALSMSHFIAHLRDSMQEDFTAGELEGFNIAMKLIHKWAEVDAEDWEGLTLRLAETAEGITSEKMAFGYNAATTALQGALIALEYVGAME